LPVAFVVLAGCSGKDSAGEESRPDLEGELCVDPHDACCCDEEQELVEANGPACIIQYAGDASLLTFELVTASGGVVLPRLGAASECTSSGGWFVASSSMMIERIELCDATCSLRRNEPTDLRVLTGCPATPCWPQARSSVFATG
jgi:hypothetical protein